MPNTNEPQTTITPETEWDCEAGSAGSEGDICIAAANDFDAHVQQEMPANKIFMPSSEGEEQYRQITWIVAQHFLNLWRVKAVTECRYNGYMENDMYKTNVKLINTLSSNYEGTNNIVNTTWTQTSKSDVVFNNFTDHATTVSYVNGVLKHKCKIPVCNDLLDRDKIVNNHLDLEF